jgi:hypothetical protein
MNTLMDPVFVRGSEVGLPDCCAASIRSRRGDLHRLASGFAASPRQAVKFPRNSQGNVQTIFPQIPFE